MLTNINILKNKKKLFCFLNGVSRTHRKTMLAWLAEYDLLDQGNISWHADNLGQNVNFTEKISGHAFSKKLRILYPTFSRINEDLDMSESEKQLHVKNNLLFSKNIKNKSISGVPNSNESRWRADFLQESLVYLISETVGDYPHVYLSEKTWKAFASKTPFMLAGAKNSLKILKDKGFKTFHDFWDENYDNIPNFYLRSKAIVEQLHYLKNQNYNKIISDCIPILNHNYNHLKQFRKDELSKLLSELQK